MNCQLHFISLEDDGSCIECINPVGLIGDYAKRRDVERERKRLKGNTRTKHDPKDDGLRLGRAANYVICHINGKRALLDE